MVLMAALGCNEDDAAVRTDRRAEQRRAPLPAFAAQRLQLNRRHPEHQELRAWAGKHFDPELFSVQAVNSALALLVALGVTS